MVPALRKAPADDLALQTGTRLLDVSIDFCLFVVSVASHSMSLRFLTYQMGQLFPRIQSVLVTGALVYMLSALPREPLESCPAVYLGLLQLEIS